MLAVALFIWIGTQFNANIWYYILVGLFGLAQLFSKVQIYMKNDESEDD